MRELVSEITVKLFEITVSAIGTVVFTIVGFLAEQEGLQKILLGQTTIGAWEAGVGLLFLFIGLYMIGYREFWRRLRTLRGEHA